MAEAVYFLCALAGAACTVLLLRAYARSRVRLLLWSGLCFTGLTLNNVFLIADKVLFPEVNLFGARSAAALAGLLVLVYGLVWDSEHPREERQ